MLCGQACQNGQTYVVMLLIDNGADVHAVTHDGDTPLDIAARFNRREVVSFLLDNDPSVIQSTRSLREAVKNGRSEIVKILLDMGMEPGAQDQQTGDR